MNKYLTKIKNISYLVSDKRRLEKPAVIQFPVIDICNSKCQMCKIWENEDSADITLDQLKQGISSSLFSEVTAVGINGGEPTLRKDLPELIDQLYLGLPKLKTISLITNGYSWRSIIKKIDRIGKIIKKYSGYLDVMVSLDGFQDVHDEVRGKPGNFEYACNVLQYCKESVYVDNLRIGCTVIKENSQSLRPLHEFALENDVYIKYRLGVPHKRLYTKDVKEPYALSDKERYEFVEFLNGVKDHYETDPNQIFFYESLINQLIDNSPRKAGCDWRHRGATITAKGELLYCALESDVLHEKIWEGDSEKSYFNGKEHLEDIKDNKCNDCNHDYVGIPSAKYFRKIRLRKFKKSLDSFSVTYSLINSLKKYIDKPLYISRVKKYKSLLGSDNKFNNNNINNILICGWYGTETLGDKAILAGVVNSLKASYSGPVKISVVSLFPYVTKITKKQMPELDSIKIISINAAYRTLNQFDHLLFGGGPLMNIFNIAEMAELFRRASCMNIYLSIAGCGVGPIGKKYIDNDIKDIINLSNLVVYRDNRSKSNMEKLGVDTKGHFVAEDPAFSWLRNRRKIIPMKNITNKKVLLLGLRDYPYVEYAPDLSLAKGSDVAKNYERILIDSLVRISNQFPDVIIKPLPMCTNHFGGDDRWFYLNLFLKVKSKIKLDDSLLHCECSPEYYAAEFDCADFGLMMRFHSVVFSISSDLPCAVIDYTRGVGKVKSLCDQFNIDNINIDSLSEDSLFEMLERLILEPYNPIAKSDDSSDFSKLYSTELSKSLANT